MGKIKPFPILVLLIGAVFFIISLWFLFDTTHYYEIQNFDIMRLISQSVTFSISGGSLVLIGFIMKRIISKTEEELQDLKNEIHNLRKEVENLKK